MDPVVLMARYCDGDAHALRELYALVGPTLLATLVDEAATPEIAAELVGRTFLVLHRARAAYVRGASPVPWIYAIARSLVGRR